VIIHHSTISSYPLLLLSLFTYILQMATMVDSTNLLNGNRQFGTDLSNILEATRVHKNIKSIKRSEAVKLPTKTSLRLSSSPPAARVQYARDELLQYQWKATPKPAALAFFPEISCMPGSDDPIPTRQIWLVKPVQDECKIKRMKMRTVEREKETDEHRLAQRQKQVDYGKNTIGYQKYVDQIPRKKRSLTDPRTPDISQKCSKRSWDGQVRKWRRLLHRFDPEDVLGLNNSTGSDSSVREELDSTTDEEDDQMNAESVALISEITNLIITSKVDDDSSLSNL